ncbi:MAG: hypothetical protein K2Y21_12340 [Phycisphaerales bacterium]|nr:hypothetical protein [Phycisphaerales bacterium]
MHPIPRLISLMVIPVVIASGLVGCRSRGGTSAPVQRDPLTVLRNPQRPNRDREQAIDIAWAQALRSPEEKPNVRESFKDMIWSSSVNHEMRKKMYDYLASDPDEAGIEDTKKLTRLMLPREPSRAMVAVMSDTAAARGWKDCVPALVRSYSRSVPTVKDEERSEKIALLKLAPERPLVETVFQVFLNPPDEDPGSPAEFRERARADAFDVLAKLDVTGEYRKRLLEDPSLSDDDDAVGLMRRSMRDLKVVPISGDEMRWLQRLAGAKNQANVNWWRSCSSLVLALPSEKAEGLHIRHLEALRIATAVHPDLVSKSRSELLSDLKSMIASRKTVQRQNEAQGTVKAAREQVEVWESKLSWGDLLTIHLLDRSIRQPDFTDRLFTYVGMDREDTTSEYGGVLTALENVGDGRGAGPDAKKVVPWLFPPRPSQRTNDQEFVASEEMFLSSDRGLAHFHFHVHRARNSDYAGPSGGDLDYAARSGRSCVVFTSIGSDDLNIDYYQPDGVVIDLGTITKK